MEKREPTKWEEWMELQHEKRYGAYNRKYFTLSQLQERDAYQAQIIDLRDNK